MQKKLQYLRNDWPVIPLVVFAVAGFLWTLFDLFDPDKSFYSIVLRFSGLFIALVGLAIELLVRFELIKKSKFPDQLSTAFLKINRGHQLITDGLFKYIRHPLYFSLALQFIGWGLFCSSLYGIVMMIIGYFFLIPRINIEEKMLIGVFGDSYVEYQKSTKKIIPFLY